MQNKIKMNIVGVISLVLFFSLCTSSIGSAASSELIWESYVLSSGTEVVSPVLKSGVNYRIVASEIFWYNYAKNFTADAQYYTTDPVNQWIWTNHLPAPGGHSFLQINNLDVNWGPFSNGEIIGDPSLIESYIGHSYTIYYTGQDAAIRFRIVDQVDGIYTNNECMLLVKIYRDYPVGGVILDSDNNNGFSPLGIVMIIGAISGVLLFRRQHKRF
jgi:hypothetical protein